MINEFQDEINKFQHKTTTEQTDFKKSTNKQMSEIN